MPWNSDLCGCCSGPDCGCNCCVQWYFCSPCVFGDLNEKAGFGGCTECCLFYFCCNPCAVSKLAMDVNKKYEGIGDSNGMIFLKGCFCNVCLQFQATNEIMFREGLKYDCASTKAVEDAPAGTAMER